MGADEVAAIRPALLELEAALEEAAQSDSGPLCASFEVEPDLTPWVQVVLGVPDTLNISFPFPAPPSPLHRLLSLGRKAPRDLQLVSHEPGDSATFVFRRGSPMELARFIDAVLEDQLGSQPSDYPVSVSLYRLTKEVST